MTGRLGKAKNKNGWHSWTCLGRRAGNFRSRTSNERENFRMNSSSHKGRFVQFFLFTS